MSVESGEAILGVAVPEAGAAPAKRGSGPAAGDVVERARAGDTAAFREIYREHVGRVHAVCLRMLRDPDAAEEAAQEAFVRAWQRLGSFEGRSAFSTWLHRLTVNVVMDRIRSAKRKALDLRSDGDEAAMERMAQPATSPHGAIDLERAIAGLPRGARIAFVLHDIEGYRHREIAEMTGTAEGTWKAQLHRARRLLREVLER